VNTSTLIQGLADDGILSVTGWVHTTDEAVVEYRDGMIRLVELLGYTRYLNGVYAALATFLRDYQRREWDSGNHDFADTIGGMVWDLDQRFHPIVVSRRAGGQAMQSHVTVTGAKGFGGVR
jgi:hypothetical protein